MNKWIAVSMILSLVLTGPVLAQAPDAGAKPDAPASARPMSMSITGKIMKTDQGYVIQGQEPKEIFTILNPNPQALDRIVKSGKSVTIEAVSVLGDNVNIKKINGKVYQEHKAGKSMGR